MNSLENIKDKVKRKATIMQIGGFKPDNKLSSSWFGMVMLCSPGEEWPSTNGKPMNALCQINLTELPYVPESLKDLELITVFIGPEAYPNNDDNGVNWCLRAYRNIENLVPLKQIATDSRIKSFQMKGILVEEDYPSWYNFTNIEDSELELEEEIEEEYWDYFNNVEGFKIGVWPSLIQSEIYWAPYNPLNMYFKLIQQRKKIGCGEIMVLDILEEAQMKDVRM
ncbi:DUF1963 domain-containing protein [Clostridium intestinale]|uniref:DUF1963 domain-containing protein n=1 Tax=Clostridium intestinale TaxID=36845 RepID=UPI0028EB8A4E|nr:DUF1963 domain-containing protein [Clostridium intestinale]